jgi:hypothetical protein
MRLARRGSLIVFHGRHYGMPGKNLNCSNGADPQAVEQVFLFMCEIFF